MKNIIFLFNFILFFHFSAISQTIGALMQHEVIINKSTINFTTLLSEITKDRPALTNPEMTLLLLNNFTVRYDSLDRNGMDKRFKEGGERLIAPYDLNIGGIDFDDTYWLVARNIHFKGFVKFTTCKNLKIILKDCIFDKNVKFNANEAKFMQFENCEFRNGLMYQLNNLSEHITFEQCKFKMSPPSKIDKQFSVFNSYDIEHQLFELLNKTEPFDLNFRRCTFEVADSLLSDKKYHINITQSNFKNLRFDDTAIHTHLNLSATTVENEFQLEEGKLLGNIVIDAFNINPQNARVQWSLLAGHKISVFDKKNALLNGLTRINSEKLYNRLIGCYSTFYQVFKSQGNRFYANSTYIEWKNIETSYLKYNFEQKGNSQIYFIYLMNIFLRDFCAYGTDPLLSIYLSGVVIVLFACFYFLFPAPINTHRANRQVYIQTFLRHFKETYLQTPSSLASSIKDKNILSKVLITYIIISKFVYILLLIMANLYFLALKILDALSLSLNVFSTLGFGEIPINGAVRYLTILEGFIGWFLLSIFSVCLISQVIQ